MAAFKFDYLYSKSGWLSPGFILINSEGWITYISEVAPPEKVMHIPGIAMPGMTNVHSHAFQRGMAGLSEYRTAATHDSFWTWRELMYQFVSRLSPDDFEAIAAQLYIEMLKSGYTAVGEFQYLHHNTDGTPFDVPAEMSLRALAAARETGIGLTLLPVFTATRVSPNSRQIGIKSVLSMIQKNFLKYIDLFQRRQGVTPTAIPASRRIVCVQ